MYWDDLAFLICLDNALRFFLSSNRQYVFDDEKLDDLGKKSVCVYQCMMLSQHTHTHTHTHSHREPCSKEVVCCHVNAGRRA